MIFINLLPEGIFAPFQYPFMQRALLTSLMVGGVCGILSCFVVLNRWSLLGDAISHAVLPGVAVAYILGWPFFIGAFVTGALTTFGIGIIERNSCVKEDSAMGIMFTGSFALGVVIISQIATSTHLMHILFGNVLGVRTSVLILTFVCSLLTIICIFLFYKEFHLYTFDPIQANALGINTTLIHYGMMLLLTLTIVASLETVGIILVVAMLITPGATAYLLCKDFAKMILIAALQGIFSGVVGLYLSFHYDIASGGTIVLVSSLIFWLAFLFSPGEGVLTRWIKAKIHKKQ
ncbi:MAG: metal ABC transporter permease [Halanaerobiales bacterium]